MPITLTGTITPQTSRIELDVIYALDMDDGYIKYRDQGSMFDQHYPGSFHSFISSYSTSHIVIPIDPMTAWRMSWIDHDTALRLMGFTEDVRAAIRLVT